MENKESKSSLEIVRQEIESTRAQVYKEKNKELEKKKDLRNRIGAAIGLLIVGGFLLSNLYLKMRMPVYLLNGFNENLTYTVDGGKEYTVEPGGYEVIRVSEGPHDYEVAGAVNRVINASFTNSFSQRFFYHTSLFAINPGAESVLSVGTTSYYAEDVEIPEDFQPTFEYLWGERIEERGIDYVFKEFPESIPLDDGVDSEERTRVYYSGYNSKEFIKNYLLSLGAEEALEYLQYYIDLYPEDAYYCYYYNFIEESYSDEIDLEDSIRYLKSQIDKGHDTVPVHRLYQNLVVSYYDSEELIDLYEALLKENSANPDYLYLRGRLSLYEDKEGDDYYDKALHIDPLHPWSNYAVGLNYFEKMEFDLSVPYIENAWRSDSENPLYEDLYLKRLFVYKEWDKLIEYTEDEFEYSSSLNLDKSERLIVYYTEAGNIAQAKEVAEDYAKLASVYGSYDYASYFNTLIAEISGEPEGYSNKYINPDSEYYMIYRDFTYYVLKEDYEYAFNLLKESRKNTESQFDFFDRDASAYFIVAVGLAKQGNQGLAEEAADLGVEIVERVDSAYSNGYNEGFKNRDLTVKEIKNMSSDPFYKSLLSLYTAYMNNGEKESYLKLARKGNIYPGFSMRAVENLSNR